MSSLKNVIRNILSDILVGRTDVSLLASQQRAKFEGWLKFELAAALSRNSAFTEITLEDGYPDGGRSDLSFVHQEVKWFVELKTANTNWRAEGLEKITRPVTRNIDGIIDDILVLEQISPPARGMAVFVIFPVPIFLWKETPEKIFYHLKRIEAETSLPEGSIQDDVHFVPLTGSYGMCVCVVEVI